MDVERRWLPVLSPSIQFDCLVKVPTTSTILSNDLRLVVVVAVIVFVVTNAWVVAWNPMPCNNVARRRKNPLFFVVAFIVVVVFIDAIPLYRLTYDKEMSWKKKQDFNSTAVFQHKLTLIL
jgi:hypothetical protein